jgi:hypothetical protein
MSHGVHTKRGGLVHPQTQVHGSWAFSIAPSRRSSLMKYLKLIINKNMLYSSHAHESGDRNKSQLGAKLIPEGNSLDGKVRVPLFLECLALSVGILPFEDACESRLPNLIMPSLNIHIDGFGLLNDIDVYFQIFLLDAL